MTVPVVYDWSTGTPTGWGTYGAALDRHATTTHDVALYALGDGHPLYAHPTTADRVPEGAVTLTALGNNGLGARDGYPPRVRRPARQVGVLFSEDTHWTAEGVGRLNRFDLIVAGSTWNADVVRALPGLTVPVVTVFQGIEPYAGGGAATLHPDRRIVFSGGKLEFRKGQDIVVAAFRDALADEPDLLLVTAWHNPWPATMAGLDLNGYVTGLPASTHPDDLTAWTTANGIPARNVMHLGPMGNDGLRMYLRAAHVAVFPNRAEGGTNLVAMEALATLPTFLSPGTGHADLYETPMAPARAVVRWPATLYRGITGWQETPVSAVVAAIRGDLPLPAPRTPWTWATQIPALLDACGIPRIA